MAVQLHALTAKLAEAQRQLELQHQIDRDRAQAASAAASAAVVAHWQLFSLLTSAAAGMAAAAAPAFPDSEALRAIQQVCIVPLSLHSACVCSC
jgi:hypothetical protein